MDEEQVIPATDAGFPRKQDSWKGAFFTLLVFILLVGVGAGSYIFGLKNTRTTSPQQTPEPETLGVEKSLEEEISLTPSATSSASPSASPKVTVSPSPKPTTIVSPNYKLQQVKPYYLVTPIPTP